MHHRALIQSKPVTLFHSVNLRHNFELRLITKAIGHHLANNSEVGVSWHVMQYIQISKAISPLTFKG